LLSGRRLSLLNVWTPDTASSTLPGWFSFMEEKSAGVSRAGQHGHGNV
jgi:hypothetical protein